MSFQSCTKGGEPATRTAGEARCVDEDTSFDTGELGELIVTDAAPLRRERLAALEALCSDRNSLDAPVTSKFIRI